MYIRISEQLRDFRRTRGNTQEELAVHLGISVQVVSKWERGEGLPDITLLPGIASFYDTTVDALLGCDELKKRERLSEFLVNCHALLNKGKQTEKLELCRAMQKEYPNAEEVRYELMYALYHTDLAENSSEITELAEKLLKSQNIDYHFGAVQVLCLMNKALGRKEKAVEYARMVPDNEDLLVHALEGKELVEHCQWYFWRACDRVQFMLSFLLECGEAGYTAEQRHAARKLVYDMYHMIFSDGDFGFWEDRLGRLCYLLALSSADAGENERSLAELEEMTVHFEKSEAFVSIDHTSPLVNRIHYEESMVGRSSGESLSSAYLKKLDNKLFDALRGEPRFIAVEKKLGKNS